MEPVTSPRFWRQIVPQTSHILDPGDINLSSWQQCSLQSQTLNQSLLSETMKSPERFSAITHSVLSEADSWSAICLQGREECSCVPIQNRAIALETSTELQQPGFKAARFHIESIPSSIRLDDLTKVRLRWRFFMVPQKPTSWICFPLWSHFKRSAAMAYPFVL